VLHLEPLLLFLLGLLLTRLQRHDNKGELKDEYNATTTRAN
jgi:hypothetical protein